ncbi:MAG: hypothetical protein WCG92_02540 [Hyphomicrobiales bacterium]|nr:hypothetical protein [Alphaproteobacteria bacterium]
MKSWPIVFAVTALAVFAGAAQAQPACSPPPEEGYRLEPSLEVIGVTDGAPYRSDVDWMLDRTTRLLPLCNYFSPVGSYSLRSYSLDPFTRTERVLLCHGATAVPPYTGPCPPQTP